ncbi:MAG: hypothetical protein BWX86_02077 [Verrucomicrobia bacterium ADurb.Bin122]|nr:MAG: hypothetical protein BWX86_02077 [Verrucomicrobia bacterium ADurb.Bin122]
MVSLPVRPCMACTALVQRLRTIWWIWVGSAQTMPGVRRWTISIEAGVAARTSLSASSIVGMILIGAALVSRLRAKVRIWATRSLARSPALRTSPSSSCNGWSAGRVIVASSLNPRMPVRMLLKSCAMPPASAPMLSIFWAWTSWASSWYRFSRSRFHSVMSRAMASTPTSSPWALWTATKRCSEMISRPSRVFRRISWMPAGTTFFSMICRMMWTSSGWVILPARRGSR